MDVGITIFPFNKYLSFFIVSVSNHDLVGVVCRGQNRPILILTGI